MAERVSFAEDQEVIEFPVVAVPEVGTKAVADALGMQKFLTPIQLSDPEEEDPNKWVWDRTSTPGELQVAPVRSGPEGDDEPPEEEDMPIAARLRPGEVVASSPWDPAGEGTPGGGGHDRDSDSDVEGGSTESDGQTNE